MIRQTKKSVIFTLDVDAREVKLKGSWNGWKEEESLPSVPSPYGSQNSILEVKP